MHKIVTLDISTRQRRKMFPYLDEHVSFPYSLQAIQDLLNRHHCTQIAIAQKEKTDPTHGTFTVYSLAFIVKEEKFLIEFPVVFVKNTRGTQLRMDISGRVVFYKVKVLLVDVEFDFLNFQEAMMPYRIITLPNGTQVPLVDYVAQHGPELTAGTADLLGLPDGIKGRGR
jgi:hypothetical protein